MHSPWQEQLSPSPAQASVPQVETEPAQVPKAFHEAPMLGFGGTGKLSDRVPVTVEPGVYLPGKGGVRIEDVLVVTAGGGARILTSTTRELLGL